MFTASGFCVHMVIRIPLFLLLMFIQRTDTENKYCPEAVQTVTAVQFCPINEEEVDKAARAKNCSQFANCSSSNPFEYHCVINGYRNETLEVCAPERVILGHCTEFNVAGGVIQQQTSAPCNQTFPRCGLWYKSTDAYMYPDCYKLVYKSRDSSTSLPVKTSSDFETTSSLFSTTSDQTESDQLPSSAINIITGIVSIAVSSGIIFAVIFCRRKRRKIRKRRIYIDDRKEEDEDTTQLLLKRSIEDTIARKQIPMETITDKYSFAVHRTDDLREENIEESNRYLRSFRTFDKYFAETHTYKKAHDYLEKYNIVVLTGPPGCGKTHIARHLMFEAASQNRTVHKIRSWEEFSFTDPEVQSLVFIDNIFYDNLINYDLVNWWKTLEDCFNNCRKRGGEGVTTRPIDPLKVIITAREHVIDNACSFMNAVTPLFNENYIISGDDFRCSDEEKELIFRKQMEYAEKEKHIPSHRIDAQFLREIKSSEGPIGFPFCAHLYACKEEYKRRGARFFSRPTEFLKIQTEFEIENDKSCKTKTLFFVLFLFEWHLKNCDPHKKLDLESEVLCRQFVNSYSPDAMQYFSPLDFKGLSTIAHKLTGPFFIKVEKGLFKFVHDSVYEAVGEFFCEKYFNPTTQLFPLDVISTHDYASLTEKQTQTLALRFLYEALNQNLSRVYTCDIFKTKSFVETFCDELRRKGENVVRCFLMIENDSSPVKLPSIFWTSRCKLPYLTDFLYEMILKEKEIDADYHMYLSLFGECCARSKNVLTTVNGVLRNNLEEIKKRVCDFVDDEGNSVLHLIIMSDRSDTFVAQAVKKIKETGFRVNCRNNLKITPLMVAVKHCEPRQDVIRQLCQHDPEIKSRDINCSSVFHHCLSSENDDERCLEYLEIILENMNKKRILKENNENGENVLNMAAKQSRYSRILCILTLMGIEEVKATIDLDGNTPIHNAIKHLKGKNKNPLLARLECSVRIILFIACDVDPEQIADDKKRPIDLCNDECVKRILEAQSPLKVAEKVFITLLNEIKVIYEKKENEEVAGPLEFPAKIPKELKSHIEEAVKYLRNADFDKTYMNTSSTLFEIDQNIVRVA